MIIQRYPRKYTRKRLLEEEEEEVKLVNWFCVMRIYLDIICPIATMGFRYIHGAQWGFTMSISESK
jgi:hypothetical protein